MNIEYNLIIKLGGEDWQTSKLKERILTSNESKTREIAILNLKPEDITKNPTQEDLEFFKKYNNSSRIYIIDHGNPNSSNIASANYQELAEFFNKRLNKENIKPGQEKLRFSLIPCHSGVGSENNAKSFAGLFHRYLGQVCHIDSDVMARLKVVMISSVAEKKGKLTTSLAHYGLMTKAYELALPLILFDISESTENYHQQPNTKMTFRWDKNGNEIMLDSYLDKFAQRTKELTADLSELLKNNPIEAEIKEKIDKKIINIERLIEQTEDLSYKEMKIVEKKLLNIILLLSQSTKADQKLKKECASKIENIIQFASASIKRNVTEAIHYDVKISDPPSLDIEPRFGKIRRDLSSLSIIELKKMPKTELEKPLKKSTSEFLQYISDSSNYKLKHDLSIEREIVIANFIKGILSIVNSLDLSQEEKVKEVDAKRKLLEDSIHNELFISAKIQGAIEGIKEARRYGGLTTLKSLLPLIDIRSEDEVTYLKEYDDFINEFTEKTIKYLQTTQYEGSSLLTREALEQQSALLASELIQPLSFMISKLELLSSCVLIDSIEAQNEQKIITLKDINLALEESSELKKNMKLSIQKLKFSLDNSPDPNIKATHMKALNEIESKLQELEKIEEEIKDEWSLNNPELSLS